jgi:hypothetical protein
MSLLTTITKVAGRVGLKARKASPEILLVGGIGCGIAAVVVACKKTLKADDILEEHAERIEKIHKAAEIDEEYKEKDMPKELTATYMRTGAKFVKLYLPAIGLGVASVTMLLASHGILKKRNAAISAAYTAVSTAFNKYRARVKDELGVDADERFRTGKHITEIVEEVTDKSGNVKDKKKKINEIILDDVSEYSRWFTKGNPQYDIRSDMYNEAFLEAQQNYFNNLLHMRGHVFLSEVYDALGFDRTPASIVVGWVDGIGDNYVDFGIVKGCYAKAYNDYNAVNPATAGGYSEGYLLDFNVDGVIYDLI